jgi:hypothetical protein
MLWRLCRCPKQLLLPIRESTEYVEHVQITEKYIHSPSKCVLASTPPQRLRAWRRQLPVAGGRGSSAEDKEAARR